MENVENVATNKEQPVATASYAESIKCQVLAKIGKPPRLDRVEVSQHYHGSNYRVNVWQRPEPSESMFVTISARIRWSYFLTVSDTGEIVHSDPPLIKLCSSA